MGILAPNTSAQGAANDSFAWSKAATALSAVGDVTSGVGGFQLANYQAATSARNAQIMLQNATAAQQAGLYTAESTLEKGGQIASHQRAGFGASNIDVNVGSAKTTPQSTEFVSAMDASINRYNAAREAYAFKTEASADTAQAGLLKSAAIGSLLGGVSKAGATLLGGASSLSGKYAQWQLGAPPNSNAPPSL